MNYTYVVCLLRPNPVTLAAGSCLASVPPLLFQAEAETTSPVYWHIFKINKKKYGLKQRLVFDHYCKQPTSCLPRVSKFNGPLLFNFLLHFKGRCLLGPWDIVSTCTWSDFNRGHFFLLPTDCVILLCPHWTPKKLSEEGRRGIWRTPPVSTPICMTALLPLGILAIPCPNPTHFEVQSNFSKWFKGLELQLKTIFPFSF